VKFLLLLLYCSF
jgi:hypothetical protein